MTFDLNKCGYVQNKMDGVSLLPAGTTSEEH